jgi:hypothetical protein
MGDDEPQRVGPLARKAARGRIGVEIQRLDELEDTAPGIFPHAGPAIEYPGDGSFGDVGYFSDIFDRHTVLLKETIAQGAGIVEELRPQQVVVCRRRACGHAAHAARIAVNSSQRPENP